MAVLMWNQRWANALLPQTLQSPPGKLAHTAPRALHLSWGGAGCEKESVRRCACVLGVGLARGGGALLNVSQVSRLLQQVEYMLSLPFRICSATGPHFGPLQNYTRPVSKPPALSQSRSLLEVKQVRNDAIGVTLTRTGQVRPGPDAQT